MANPEASAYKRVKLDAVEHQLAAAHDVTMARTEERDHATALAREAAATGIEAVVVLGGDGTINEAANGLAGSATALAVLPGGMTNVFARTIGTPRGLTKAVDRVLGALALGSIRSIGLGNVDGRYFLCHVGIGYDAATVERVERLDRFKPYAGQALFLWAALTTWLRHYDRSRPHFAVHHGPDDVVEGFFTIVQNTNPYTFLGPRPLDVAPEATLERPLTAITFRNLGLPLTVSAIGAALRGRPESLPRKPGLAYRTDLIDVRVVGHGSFPYQADGDFLGEVDSLVLHHEPGVLQLVVP